MAALDGGAEATNLRSARSPKQGKYTPTTSDQRKQDFPVADSTRFRTFGRELVVVGTYMAPDQRRHLPGAWVNPCPGCGLAHIFRGVEQGSTVTRVAPCRIRLRVHVAAPSWYGLDGDDDWWADDDGNVLRGNQAWIPRAAA